MEQEEDFAALFEASEASRQTRRFRNGQTVEGTIVAIGPEVAFVSVGGKGEATMSVDELKNDDGVVEVAVGDRIQAIVVSHEGSLVLSRKMALGAASAGQLEEAFQAGLPVEGKVEAVVKGGYEVRIARLRAFCPFSQIDVIRTEDPAVHQGRVYAFRIIEFRDGGQKFVVSRRTILEQDQAARAAEFWKSIAVGDVRTGRVVQLMEFGAFVDLGAGVHGLIHVSEMAWGRVSNPSELLKLGDDVTVKVVGIDGPKQRIALSLKQLGADPWDTVKDRYQVAQVITGTVTRVAEHGAFVELEPGIEALAHSSTFAPRGKAGGWAKGIRVGMAGMFEILSIDPDKKRIGVAMIEEGSAKASVASSPAGEAAEVREYSERAVAEQSQAFGTLAEKLRGALLKKEQS